MTQTLIEKLEALPRYRPSAGIAGSAFQHSQGKWVLYDDLRSIIEQHKSEAVEPVAVPAGYKMVPIEPTDDMKRAYTDKYGFPSYGAGHEYRFMVREAPEAPQPELARCKSCNGNDCDMPCAYPSEGKHGCLRDARLAPQPDHSTLEAVEPVAIDSGYIEGTAERLRLICSKLGIGAPESNEELMLCQFSLFGLIRGKIDAIYKTQPDHTKLIGELVEALDDANKKIKKAKDFEYQAEMYISDSEFELDGFLGNTAAEISVTWQKAIDANNALLTKAREAIK